MWLSSAVVVVSNAIARTLRRVRPRKTLPGASTTSPEWYNEAFSTVAEYRAPYWNSRYYFAWAVIGDRLVKSGNESVLEVGCGTGQLAQLLLDWGVGTYHGFDFSSVAVDVARAQAPAGVFEVADARTTDLFESVPYDWVLCTEVLEHIEFDLEVIEKFRSGSSALCTVPSFDYVSHLRHFKSATEVEERYAPYFDDFTVRTLRMPNSDRDYYFLFQGIRNNKR